MDADIDDEGNKEAADRHEEDASVQPDGGEGDVVDTGDAANTSETASKDSPEIITRREFLNKISIGAIGAGAAVVGLPIAGYLLAPLLQPAPRIWRPVGPVDQFKVGETVEVKFEDASPLPWAGVAAMTAAWLRRDTLTDFTAFSVHCSHLGCPVNWLSGASLFVCPCHGGVYYKDGTVAAGPPPRSLTEYPVRINNGQVEILTSPVPVG